MELRETSDPEDGAPDDDGGPGKGRSFAGIDLNLSKGPYVELNRQGEGVHLSLDTASIHRLRSSGSKGFVPVIIDIALIVDISEITGDLGGTPPNTLRDDV